MIFIEKGGENPRCSDCVNQPPNPPAQVRTEPTIKPDGHERCGKRKTVSAKIPADLSRCGKEVWKPCWIDACLAPIINALQLAGVDMRGSCCGHGEQFGEIYLQDGRLLLVLRPEQAREYLTFQTPCNRWVLRLEEMP